MTKNKVAPFFLDTVYMCHSIRNASHSPLSLVLSSFFVFHVRMYYVLNSYLLTYLLTLQRRRVLINILIQSLVVSRTVRLQKRQNDC